MPAWPSDSHLRIGICLAAAVGLLVAPWTSAQAALSARQVGVVINADDPDSVATGIYYAQQRGIPAEQIVVVRLGAPRPVMRRDTFAEAAALVDATLPKQVQALALTWKEPYRVDCMSVTSAFSFGFDDRFCARGCQPTAPSPMFNAASKTPYQDFGVRLSMSIAGENLRQQKQLIDRGIRADGTRPGGVGYLLSTTDAARNVRTRSYARIERDIGPGFRIARLEADRLVDRFDIMFYFTGLARVDGLQRLGFRPGAIADHLTSAGGKLTDSNQMSSLEWLAAGATGSYGAVVEPCNFPEKFPDPYLVMRYYLGGDTLIEAYWKSVAWPGQGIFIGEPLARPFAQ